jgi:hypothetical protein
LVQIVGIDERVTPVRATGLLIPATIVAMLSGMAAAAGAAWPRVPGQGTDWVESLSEPQWPAVAGASSSPSDGGPRWPAVGGEVERRFPSPFAFEIGARYWYSRGTTKFGFTNGYPGDGSPTSALDWNNSSGHSGEVFGRVDHRPTGLFVKGMIGAGGLRGGEFVDRDYTDGQWTWSDTTSEIRGDNLRYATVDVGMSYELPRYGVRLGGFVGYHYWREKMTAYGLVCNADDYGQHYSKCTAGSLDIPYDTAVIGYEPSWHAMRVGLDARFRIGERWSVSGEAALIPIAWLDNKDSHLLRQDMPSPANHWTGLGPAPNILTKGIGWGGMGEIFVNYEVTPNIEFGAGLRYWGINAYKGDVTFGPSFNHNYSLDYFDMSRYGVLAHIKGKF